MLDFFKKRKAKKAIKSTFKEYGHKIKQFDIDEYGRVEYAQWLHPFEGPKSVTKSQVNFYKEFAGEGQMIIDIGAHTGDTTVPMALAVGKKGIVLGLEPNPYVYKILEENAKLNQEITNIVPLPFAATIEDGEFVFNYSDASFCNGGFLSQIKSRRHKHNYELKVQGRDFQKFLNENYADRLSQLSLLKVDAEGYDKDILNGLSELISTYRPNIMAECYKRLTMEEREDLYDAMAKHNYTVYLNDTHYLSDGFVDTAKRVKLTKDTMNIKKHFEIIAIPN
ncbi:FkbM family methyltransferase [Roseivirga sp.]|uniref:FkbM family methyltransferase n=1 Tax=Roseivirga sp. TaxID=1964215 RepID=UPI002B278F95|nr:FkbM family methyltransferase [Roseivirga sp.]